MRLCGEIRAGAAIKAERLRGGVTWRRIMKEMNSEKKLNQLLEDWRCDYGADPWIEDRVWLRINSVEIEEERPSFFAEIRWLASPALACMVVILAAAGGIGAGELVGRSASAQANTAAGSEQLAERYFQSINPVALAASHREERQ